MREAPGQADASRTLTLKKHVMVMVVVMPPRVVVVMMVVMMVMGNDHYLSNLRFGFRLLGEPRVIGL